MTAISQNKPETGAMKILRICHQHPGISLQAPIEKSGQSSANVGRVVQNLRGSGNLCPTKNKEGKAGRGHYDVTVKGLSAIGVEKPLATATVTATRHTTVGQAWTAPVMQCTRPQLERIPTVGLLC